jgi:hypothetical protein
MFDMRKGLLVLPLLLCLGVSMLVACAPKQATPAEGPDVSAEDSAAQIELPAWTSESDCASCHVNQFASQSSPDCLTSKHAVLACVTCHADDSALAKAHENYATAKQPTKLKKTEVTRNSCLSSGCHDQESLKAVTADVTVLRDDEGLVANPHDLSANDKHEGIVCADCHTMHEPYELEPEARQACINCHHENVYQCGTCHSV